MRVAMIGAGHWHAGIHLQSLRIAHARIVGISDQDWETAQAFSIQAECAPFKNYHHMLKATKPDFVVAMGRPIDMPEIVRDLLDTGIPFAAEKPIGTSATDLQPLVDIARQRNAFVAVPFVNRYCALWTQIEQLEQSQRLGLRSHAHFRLVNGPPERYRKWRVPWNLDPDIAGGGSLRNLGIHCIDAFLHFTGENDIEVIGAAISNRVYNEAVEEIGTAILCSSAGVIGTVEAGYTFAALDSGDLEWRVATANGYLVQHVDELHMTTLDDGVSVRIADPDSRYDSFATDTFKRLQDGRPPIATLEDCYRAMHVIDQIYHTAVRVGNLLDPAGRQTQ